MARTRTALPDWPAERVDVGEVRDWISSALPGHPRVTDPIVVYQVKVWGVTACFGIIWARSPDQRAPSDESNLDREVVFKAPLLPIFRAAPRIHRLLQRHCSGAVPELLTWAERPEGTWMLFRPFRGSPLASLDGLEPLLNLARSMARIQAAVAALPDSETQELPRFRLHRIPEAFDAVLDEIQSRNLAYLSLHRYQLARNLKTSPDLLGPDLLGRLSQFRSRIAEWTAELQDGCWPESTDHVDLQVNNAAVKPGGEILIYDWEEAMLSCPFFSIDRLFEDASARDECQRSGLKRGQGLEASPSAQAIRGAYLDALPWQTPERRERALTLALCISPIKAAYEGKVFAEALGWEHGCPWVTAESMVSALQRWEAMARPCGAAQGRHAQ